METKMIEIRDRGTFVPALAVKLSSSNQQEQFLLSRAGWSDEAIRGSAETGIMLYPFNGYRAHTDVYDWEARNGSRTFQVVHKFLEKNWLLVTPGMVVDVEFILGETAAPKLSERMTDGY